MPSKEKPFRLTPTERAICIKLSYSTYGASPINRLIRRDSDTDKTAMNQLIKLGLVKYSSVGDFANRHNQTEEMLRCIPEFTKADLHQTCLELKLNVWKLYK